MPTLPVNLIGLVRPLAISALVLLLLVIAFGWILADTQRIIQQDAIAAQQLEQEKNYNATLVARQTEVTTDEYIESYARKHFKYSRQDETLYYPKNTPVPTPTPTPTSTPTPPLNSSFLEKLVEFFYGPATP